jgi:hypothetical protein
MQLWVEPGQRIQSHPRPDAYLRVRCFDAESHSRKGHSQPVGYNGRHKAIAAVEAGAKGYVALSDAPEEERGAGVWAKNADLTKVYPILAVERDSRSGDIFVVVARPVPANSVASTSA